MSPNPAPITRASILTSIGQLGDVLDAELNLVLGRPAVTPEEKQQIRVMVDDLRTELADTAADVTVSADPVTTWNSWVQDSIVPRLTSLSDLLQQFAAIPRGCCFYDAGHFPSTQAECNLPGSTWSPSPCHRTPVPAPQNATSGTQT